MKECNELLACKKHPPIGVAISEQRGKRNRNEGDKKYPSDKLPEKKNDLLRNEALAKEEHNELNVKNLQNGIFFEACDLLQILSKDCHSEKIALFKGSKLLLSDSEHADQSVKYSLS
jgi:hypothetical protein